MINSTDDPATFDQHAFAQQQTEKVRRWVGSKIILYHARLRVRRPLGKAG